MKALKLQQANGCLHTIRQETLPKINFTSMRLYFGIVMTAACLSQDFPDLPCPATELAADMQCPTERSMLSVTRFGRFLKQRLGLQGVVWQLCDGSVAALDLHGDTV